MQSKKNEETIINLNEASETSRFRKVQPQNGHPCQKLQPLVRKHIIKESIKESSQDKYIASLVGTSFKYWEKSRFTLKNAQ